MPTEDGIKAFEAQIFRILGPKIGSNGPRIFVEDAIRFYRFARHLERTHPAKTPRCEAAT